MIIGLIIPLITFYFVKYATYKRKMSKCFFVEKVSPTKPSETNTFIESDYSVAD